MPEVDPGDVAALTNDGDVDTVVPNRDGASQELHPR